MTYESFVATLGQAGLNLVGCVDPLVARGCCTAPAAAVGLPEAGSVLVCGSGGRGHWQALTPADREHDHPIHHHGVAVTRAALPLLAPDARVLSNDETLGLDLRGLAAAAGWGMVSPFLHLLIHPTYGPWVSIRAVVVTGAVFARTPAAAFDPCGPCARPCLDACPAGAYQRGQAFRFEPCAEHRLQERAPPQHCAEGCHARQACVVGPEHAYRADEYRHRHRANLADIRWHYEQGRRG